MADFNWNTLFNDTSTVASDYGNLDVNETYNMEIMKTELNPRGYLRLALKTVSGETGMGTFINAFYSLDETKEENFRKMDADRLRKLADAIGFDLMSTAGLNGLEILSKVSDMAKGKTISARVKPAAEYQGKKQWTLDYWSVSKGLLADPSQEKPPVKTSSEQLNTDFGF